MSTTLLSFLPNPRPQISGTGIPSGTKVSASSTGMTVAIDTAIGATSVPAGSLILLDTHCNVGLSNHLGTPWGGVTCDPSGQLVELDLESNTLDGTVPSELGGLTALVSNLKLASNKLAGVLPTELGRMTAVVSNFDFTANQLTNAVPSQVGEGRDRPTTRLAT